MKITDFIKYTLAGIVFGIILTKAEVVSWWRIYEMFKFQSFHMYGVIGSAVTVGVISVFLLKKFKINSFAGEPLQYKLKEYNKGTIIGGILFGIGWAITGACPGPIYSLIGSGSLGYIIVLFGALIGVIAFSIFYEKTSRSN